MGRPKLKRKKSEMSPLEKARAKLKEKRDAEKAKEALAPKKRRGRPKGGVAKKTAPKMQKRRGPKKKSIVMKSVIGGKFNFVVGVNSNLTGFNRKSDAEAFIHSTIVDRGEVLKNIQVFSVIPIDVKALI